MCKCVHKNARHCKMHWPDFQHGKIIAGKPLHHILGEVRKLILVLLTISVITLRSTVACRHRSVSTRQQSLLAERPTAKITLSNRPSWISWSGEFRRITSITGNLLPLTMGNKSLICTVYSLMVLVLVLVLVTCFISSVVLCHKCKFSVILNF